MVWKWGVEMTMYLWRKMLLRKILKKLWRKKLETTKRRPSPDQGNRELKYQMIQSLLSVQNVEQFIHRDQVC